MSNYECEDYDSFEDCMEAAAEKAEQRYSEARDDALTEIHSLEDAERYLEQHPTMFRYIPEKYQEMMRRGNEMA